MTTQQGSHRVDSNGSVTTQNTSTIVTVDPNQQQQQQKPTKPEHVPDKFWNAETGAVNYEAWAKSTTELEQRFHSQQQNPKDQSQQQQQSSTQQQQPNAIAAATQKASEEIASTGKISDETFKSFEDAGIPRELVEAHAEGVIAVQAAIKAEVHSVTGDESGWQAASEWAAVNLDAADQNALNARLAKRATMKAAVQELWEKYQAANGKDGKKSSTGSQNNPGGIEPYKNKDEMMAAVRSPQYKSDPAFRELHGRRIIASERAGINVFM